MEHQKGASGLGQIRGDIEAGGDRPYKLCGVAYTGGTGSDPVWGRYVGLVSCHGEADSGGPHGFFSIVDTETGEETMGQDMAGGRERDRYECGRDSGHMDIYQ